MFNRANSRRADLWCSFKRGATCIFARTVSGESFIALQMVGTDAFKSHSRLISVQLLVVFKILFTIRRLSRLDKTFERPPGFFFYIFLDQQENFE